MKGKAKRANNNIATAITLLIIMIAVAVSSWLYLGQMSLSAKADKAYRNVTFTDALLACQSYTRERYGDRLKQLTMDSHSSRWEQKVGQYKIFFKATMSSGKPNAVPAEYWVSCDISGRSGKVRDYDVLEDKNLKTKAQRIDGGGLFGWP